ncbi:MAG: four helix bundle protein [Pyrinomonadaceae bacterium]|nr:four helix bundle protein [Pyrinomonadaceae bacterium]
MKRTNFENLEIYKLSEILADEVWNIVSDWKNLAQDTVGKQIIRSADSIGANIAEGSGRGTAQDNRRFLRMARGSLYETRHWLRRAYKRNLISSESTEKILPIINELVPKLNSYLNKVTETIRQSGKT